MNCVKVQRLLSRYLDNELLNEKLATSIEEHLRQCAGCNAELTALKGVKGLVAAKERIGARESFLDNIKEKLNNKDQAHIVTIKWLPEAGNLARKLIPVPVVITAAMFVFLSARINGVNLVDEYIFADLSTQEAGVLNGSADSSNLEYILGGE